MMARSGGSKVKLEDGTIIPASEYKGQEKKKTPSKKKAPKDKPEEDGGNES